MLDDVENVDDVEELTGVVVTVDERVVTDVPGAVTVKVNAEVTIVVGTVEMKIVDD